MGNMRIRTRLLLGFAAIVALTVAMGVFAILKENAVRTFTRQMDERDFHVLDRFRQIAKGEDEMRATRELAMVRALLRRERLSSEDPALSQQQWEQSKEQNLRLLADLESSTQGFEQTALTQSRAEQWREIRFAARGAADALRALVPNAENQFSYLNRGMITEAVALMPELERARQAYESKLADASRLTEEQIATGRGEVERYYAESRASVIVAIIAVALLGILFSTIIQRSISGPLAAFLGFVDRVGKGDLTSQAPSDRRDELGDLARGLNRMVEGLRGVASQTRGVAENLSAATAEILASTQQQAAGTAEQAAAVQQANATMAQITQSGAQISERAKQVAASAEATSSASASGLQSVRNTTTTMESIREQAEAVADNVIALSDKTKAIAEIISTVNDIAEQSHLLALNAAIEAAAAGEYGRSFSVVAAEMKNLAEQSKQATVQVRSILGDIQQAITGSVMLTEEAVKRVEAGRQQADVADRTIRALSDNIQSSVQAFQQIVAGSNQQQIGFEQVTQAFRNIGIAAQQTATSTKQSEKAAANLNALAQQLRAAVETYRL